jgi:hypothetical protein
LKRDCRHVNQKHGNDERLLCKPFRYSCQTDSKKQNTPGADPTEGGGEVTAAAGASKAI